MKKFVIALMAFALVITLAGCGGGGGGGEAAHWGDEGKNLPEEIKSNYDVMKKAFTPSTVNALADKNARETYILNNFTRYVSPTATFMGNNSYNKNKMTSRLTSVLGSYKIDSYEFKPGETSKKSDTKYTSWVYCVLNATNKNDKNTKRNLGHWMLFTWEKSGDEWYITDGFDNKKWFE